MTREERTMMFKSKLPALIGEFQRVNNRLISQNDIAKATGLSRGTINKWANPNEEIGYLDPDIAFKLCRYFECTLNDLVTIVPRSGEAA